jgi:O-methyltransferase
MNKRFVHEFFHLFGLDIHYYPPKGNEFPPDFRSDEMEIVRAVSPFTMTSQERIYVLIQAVRYLKSAGIPGSIVECGVWRGGSMATVARTLIQTGDTSRDLYLFDTFAGMTEPTAADLDYAGKHATNVIKDAPGAFCGEAPLEQVREVMYATGYPKEKIHLIEGPVEKTIPGAAPETIALLRLDTDWYESTHHELIHLYPRLERNGVLIIDDYGHWQGSRKACDEYFAANHIAILLNRIDFGGRIAIKP